MGAATDGGAALRNAASDSAAPGSSASATSRWRTLRTPLLVGIGGLGAALLLHLRDPNVSGSYGLCPFKAVTGGLDCPGCGGLRAVHALTDLDITAALSSNILAVALVVVLTVAFVLWIPRRIAHPDARMIVLSPRVGSVVLVLMLVFAVIRNTPWGSWLAS